jgi:tRNA nucleotidyltransferase/poly(A) polymerase
MKKYFTSHTTKNKFILKIYNLLVENFPETYLVGGSARDILIKKSVSDIDISTQAKPQQIIKIFENQPFNINKSAISLGVIFISTSKYSAAISSFRTDSYKHGRYPKISFTNSIRTDSNRRDFTINALYLSIKSNKIFDFHNGLNDIKNRQLKFIGEPKKRIFEDPLRIIRALRFSLLLKFIIISLFCVIFVGLLLADVNNLSF